MDLTSGDYVLHTFVLSHTPRHWTIIQWHNNTHHAEKKLIVETAYPLLCTEYQQVSNTHLVKFDILTLFILLDFHFWAVRILGRVV